MTLEGAAERRDGVLPISLVRDAVSPRPRSSTPRDRALAIHPPWGVIAIDGAPRTWRQSLRAAVLAAGTGIVASRVDGLPLRGRERCPERHEVSGPALVARCE